MMTIKEYMEKSRYGNRPTDAVWTTEEVEIALRGYGHVIMLEVQNDIKKYIDDQWDKVSSGMESTDAQ